MFLFGISDHAGGFDPLILLLMALVTETYAGQLGFLARLAGHPRSVLENLTSWFDRKLNRENRSQTDRAVRGALAALIIIMISGAIGWGVAWLSQTLPFAWVFETILLIMLINQRGVYKTVRGVGIALRDQGVEVARQKIAPLTAEAPEKMDGHSIARTAIETAATALTTRVVAPVFWYVLFGFPGLLIYQALAIMSKKLKPKTDHYRAFGFAAAQLYDIILLIPAQLSGIFINLACIFVPTAHPGRSFKITLKDAGKYHSYNLGVAVSAFAGAFDLALGGPRKFSQKTNNEPWIGNGSAQATTKDIRRSLYLFAVACLLNGVWVAALTLIRYM